MNKTLLFFFSLAFTLNSCSTNINRTDEELEYVLFDAGEESYYSVNGYNKKLSGQIIIPDFYHNIPVKKMYDISSKNITSLVIGSNIESITGVNGLSIKEIVIPNSVKRIDNSFCDCLGLELVHFGTSLETIVDSFNNISITEITFPDSISYISPFSFRNNKSLVSFTSIGERYRSDDGVLFCDNSISFFPTNRGGKYHIPEHISQVDQYCFYGCEKLLTIEFNNNIQSINYRAFSGCCSLSEITFSSSIKYIKERAFENCTSLEELSLPTYLEEMSSVSFLGCEKIKTINIASYNNTYNVINNMLIDIKKMSIVFSPSSHENEIVFPEGVKEIEPFCFYKDKTIVDLIVPSTIEMINVRAFSLCTNLKRISFHGNKISLGTMAFAGCEILEEVLFPDNIFCTYFPMSCFSSCISLNKIIIPKTIELLEKNIFDGCLNLHQLNYEGSTIEWNKIRKDMDWSYNSGVQSVICSDGNISLLR